jgi:hypothetical protein
MTTRYKKIISRTLSFLFLATMVFSPGRVSATDNFDRIRADLRNSDWKVRLSAIERIENRRDESILNMMREIAGARSEYWPVKIKAILLLGEAQDPGAVELLLTIFNDSFSNWECPSIKSYTAIALGNFKGNSKVVDTLISGVSDRELLTREAAIQSLGRIGDARALPHLVGLLGDRSIAIRLSTIKALDGIGAPEAIPYLERAAENESDPLIKSEALAALRNCRGKRAANEKDFPRQ